MASVVPSSRGLARLMAKDLDADARVVELGAGTGTLTQAIIERGVQPRNLYLVEQNAAFASILRIQFPAVTVVQASAEFLPEHLSALTGTVDYVIPAVSRFSGSTRRRRRESSLELSSC